MHAAEHLVVVDGPNETEQVLKAVFEPRGIAVSRIRHGDAVGPPQRPRLVVLHEAPGADESWSSVPRVVIGSAEVADVDDDHRAGLPDLFQYGELVGVVERMLQNTSPA